MQDSGQEFGFRVVVKSWDYDLPSGVDVARFPKFIFSEFELNLNSVENGEKYGWGLVFVNQMEYQPSPTSSNDKILFISMDSSTGEPKSDKALTLTCTGDASSSSKCPLDHILDHSQFRKNLLTTGITNPTKATPDTRNVLTICSLNIDKLEFQCLITLNYIYNNKYFDV